jgi:hypothetical protein
VHGNYVFAGTNSNGVLRSSDSGESWIPVNSGLPDSVSALSLAVSDNNIFAGTSRGIFVSQSDGTTWSAAGSGVPAGDSVNSLAVSNGVVFAGTALGVFYSANSGMNWTAFNTGFASVNIASLAADGSTLFAAAADGTIWRRPLLQVSVKHVLTTDPARFSCAITTSGRHDSDIIIRFFLGRAQRVCVAMYDLAGRATAIIADGSFSPGPHALRWRAHPMAAGCYIVRIKTKTDLVTKAIQIPLR